MLLFFGHICKGADPRRGKNMSLGPLFKTSQTGRIQQQTKCIAMSLWDEVMLFFVPFESQFLYVFWRLVELSYFALFYANSIDFNEVKYLLFIYFV